MRFKLLLLTLPVLFLPLAVDYSGLVPSQSYYISDFAMTVLIPAAYVFLLTRQGITLTALGLGHPGYGGETIRHIAICTLAYLAFVPITNIAAAVLNTPHLHSENLISADASTVHRGLLGIFYLSLSAALAEEILFRGALGAICLEQMGVANRRIFVIASASLFAVAHVNTHDLPELIGVFYVGVISAILYIRNRNLWPLIIAHFLLDTYVFYRVAQRAM